MSSEGRARPPLATRSSTKATLTVDPATLTITASGASQTYGGATPTLTGTVSGFVNGQTLADATTGALTFTASADAESNVGSYAIDDTGLSADNGNYVFVQAASNANALTVDSGDADHHGEIMRARPMARPMPSPAPSSPPAGW